MTEYRPWGSYDILHTSPTMTIKTLRVLPGQALSLQFHWNREELWIPLDLRTRLLEFHINGEIFRATTGKSYKVQRLVPHRIVNESAVQVEILEIITGIYDEDDIVRVADRYGRK